MAIVGVPITYGEPAPFTGQLLATDHAIQLGQKAMHCDTLCGLKLARTSSRAAIRLDLERSLAIIRGEAHHRLGFAEGYQAGIEVSKVPWYREPLVVAGLTAALMVGAYVAVKEGAK